MIDSFETNEILGCCVARHPPRAVVTMRATDRIIQRKKILS